MSAAVVGTICFLFRSCAEAPHAEPTREGGEGDLSVLRELRFRHARPVLKKSWMPAMLIACVWM